VNLVLVLTDRCNRSCSYCYSDRQGAGEMSFEVARRAVELARERSETPLRIGFFGGEPLLRFDRLREIADHARAVCETGPRFHLTTNGDALSEEVAEYFGELDVEVALSAHDREPEAVLRAAHRLREVGVEPRAVLVATPENAGELIGRIEGLIDADFEVVSISPDFYSPWPAAARERLERAYRELAGLYARRRRAGRPFRTNQLDPRLRALATGLPLRETHCELGAESLTVAPDGTLYPCDRLAVDSACAGTRIGHVDHGVDEVALERIALERERIPEACHTCDESLTCLGACACVNVHASGDAGLVPEVVCWHERLAGRLARELAPLSPLATPARRHRLLRLGAGLLLTGSLLTACGEEPTVAPSKKPDPEPPREPQSWQGGLQDEFYDVELVDARGDGGHATLHVQLELSDHNVREQILRSHEPEIGALLKRLFATTPIEKLTLNEEEQRISRELVEELRGILGEDVPIKGIDLQIWTKEEHTDLRHRLESLGYVGIGD